MAVRDAQQGLGRPVVVPQREFSDGAEVGADAVEDFDRIGAAPFVDGLVEIAEEGGAIGIGGEQADDFVFGKVGVLDLVHLDPAEAGGPLGALFREQGEHGPGAVKEIGEIEGVSFGELLVIGAEALAEEIGKTGGVQSRDDSEGEIFGRAVGLELGDLRVGGGVPEAGAVPEQFDAVILVIDDEVRAESEIAGFNAEHPGAEAVEGLDAAVLGSSPAGFGDGLAHVLGGTVGEGDTEGFLRWHASGDDGGEAVGHDPGLSGACGCQDQERAIEMTEDGCLLLVGIAHGIGEMLVCQRIESRLKG